MRKRETVSHPFQIFDEVRIINLVDRADRRREMTQQLERLGGAPPNTSFFEAHRPDSAGEFPSIGARGCFESHLAILRAARDRQSKSVLLLEDDFDFTRDGVQRTNRILAQLSTTHWGIFYGGHLLPAGDQRGLVRIASDEPVLTTSFVAFNRPVIAELVSFLEAMLRRPAGSPDYGPMHVDGAYTVFREVNPRHETFAAIPSLGRQRSSPSDINPGGTILDRWSGMQTIAALLRRSYNWFQRQ
jgi:glycosyl transferase, family 25